jgi:uncharacterized membrane-anchored protein YitT (DUF2179 family)
MIPNQAANVQFIMRRLINQKLKWLLRLVAYFLPFLKGVGMDILWPQMAALAALGLITLWFTSRKFKKTIG